MFSQKLFLFLCRFTGTYLQHNKAQSMKTIYTLKMKKIVSSYHCSCYTVLVALSHIWGLVKIFQKVFYVLLVCPGLALARNLWILRRSNGLRALWSVLKGSILPDCFLLSILFVSERKCCLLDLRRLNKLLKHQEAVGLGKSWILASLTAEEAAQM